ncbi:MAG: hypothetical protein AMS18_00280 [Gemmatimonas sp. SG8_17]|nr:MAG: hypothetical protein AMS18_00280 [Gemmatimonas sp. SG8_17]
MGTKDDGWVVLTRRTNDPKLFWIEMLLRVKFGIETKRDGESFHAPIMKVRKEDHDIGWAIVVLFDEIEDDDPMFPS